MENIKTEMVTKRNSSFELLRIIAMLMIISHHFSLWGQGMAADFSEGINRYVAQIYFVGGCLGVDIFWIIMGYFMSQSKFKIEKVIKIDFAMIFYSVIAVLICVFALKQNITVEDWVKAFFPLSTESHWFMTFYVAVYFLSPLFNRAIKNLEKKQFTVIVAVMFFIVCVTPILFLPLRLSHFNHYSLIPIYGYFIGAYLRKYPVKFMDNVPVALSVFVTCLVILSCASILGAKYPDNHLLHALKDMLVTHSTVVMIICAVSAVMLFKNIKLGKVNAINIISQTTFGIYIIHELPLLRGVIWGQVFKTQNMVHEPMFILNSLRIIFTLFIGCGIIETVRIYLIEKNIRKIHIFDRVFDKVNNFLNINK